MKQHNETVNTMEQKWERCDQEQKWMESWTKEMYFEKLQ